MSDKTEELPRGTEVMVEKADLPLGEGESLNDFNRKLEEGLKEHFHKLEFSDKISDIWPTEIYPDRVVTNVYWDHEKTDLRSRGPSFFQVPYKRSSTGFEFGETTEVERNTTWVPKVKIQKSTDKGLWDDVIYTRGDR